MRAGSTRCTAMKRRADFPSGLPMIEARLRVANNPVFGAAENPSGFAYPAAGAFATIPQMERQPPRPAPRNGAHSEEILASRLSLSSGEIARLIDAGIVGTD